MADITEAFGSGKISVRLGRKLLSLDEVKDFKVGDLPSCEITVNGRQVQVIVKDTEVMYILDGKTTYPKSSVADPNVDAIDLIADAYARDEHYIAEEKRIQRLF
ncbi:MAG TPA: hypothetical protein VJG30_03295 [Candidatus Nanoarchaeia archaeon]|nr:hypothetical protein [Candidatus Nanoarchaeia archaeon]